MFNEVHTEMSLDKAIKHHEEEEDMLRTAAAQCDMTDPVESKMAYNDINAAREHRQYAAWLKELKERRKADELQRNQEV